MKKILLLACLAAGLSSTAAHAQGARIGIKAGPSLTSLIGKDADGFKYKFGFHGGILAELGVTDNFAIQPEVLFSMKGAKVDDSQDGRVNQSYIDVPVLFKVKADGLFFEAGPQVGFLANAKYKEDGISESAKSDLKKVDFGYAAGLGYQAASGPMIGLRYNGGFTKVGSSQTYGNIKLEAGKVYNSAFQLYVGYLFGGK